MEILAFLPTSMLAGCSFTQLQQGSFNSFPISGDDKEESNAKRKFSTRQQAIGIIPALIVLCSFAVAGATSDLILK